jgi:hypothetical protein
VSTSQRGSLEELSGLFLLDERNLSSKTVSMLNIACEKKTLMNRLLTTFRLSNSEASALSSLDSPSGSSATSTWLFFLAILTRLPFLSYKPIVVDVVSGPRIVSHSKCSNILGIVNFFESAFRYLKCCIPGERNCK